MKRPIVKVSDHAVLRFLERQHGLDVEGIRRGLERGLEPVAALGATALSIGKVKLLLRTLPAYEDGVPVMLCATTLERWMLGTDDHSRDHSGKARKQVKSQSGDGDER